MQKRHRMIVHRLVDLPSDVLEPILFDFNYSLDDFENICRTCKCFNTFLSASVQDSRHVINQFQACRYQNQEYSTSGDATSILFEFLSHDFKSNFLRILAPYFVSMIEWGRHSFVTRPMTDAIARFDEHDKQNAIVRLGRLFALLTTRDPHDWLGREVKRSYGHSWELRYHGLAISLAQLIEVTAEVAPFCVIMSCNVARWDSGFDDDLSSLLTLWHYLKRMGFSQAAWMNELNSQIKMKKKRQAAISD